MGVCILIKIILSCLIIIAGAVIIFSIFFNNSKKITEMNIENKDTLEKCLKSQIILDTSIGICYILIGILWVFNKLNNEQAAILATLFLLLDKIVQIKINKKYKNAN